MMIDAKSLPRTKELILSYITSRGPSLPVNVAQYVRTSPLFASAFLSELYREQKLLMSDLRVGSSTLYLIRGQEQQLENFVQHLNQKEQEAFHLLKQYKVLEDSQLQPAIRVAIKEIKDFAVPIKTKTDTEEKLFWKYAFITDEEANAIINKKPIEEKKEVKKEEEKNERVEIKEKLIEQEDKLVKQIKTEIEKEIIPAKEKVEIKEKLKIKKEKKKLKVQESKFTSDLKEYLRIKDIEILETIEEKAKELTAKIRINDLFGKQEYFLIAKDRKKVKEEDLTLVLHKANQNKMLALFMAPGDLDKKAIEFISEYKNIVKFEKLKF